MLVRGCNVGYLCGGSFTVVVVVVVVVETGREGGQDMLKLGYLGRLS